MIKVVEKILCLGLKKLKSVSFTYTEEEVSFAPF